MKNDEYEAGDTAEPGDKETTQARIYRCVRRDLAAGQYVPGQPLSIRHLSDRFGVSATPVREVLRRLEAEYVLVRGANRALVVPQLSVRDLKDTQQLRMAVEGLASKMAAERASPQEIAELEQCVSAMQSALDAGETDKYLQLNWKFHQAVYSAAKSDITIHMIETLWLRGGPYIRPAVIEAAAAAGLDRTHSMKCHRQCLDAIKRGDGPAARDAICADIEAAATELLQYFQTLLDQRNKTLPHEHEILPI